MTRPDGWPDPLPAWVHETAEIPCPACGKRNRHACMTNDGAPEALPADGDWAMCWTCGEVAVFVVGPFGLTQRPLTDAERVEADDDPELKRARAARAESYRPSEAIELVRPGVTGGQR